MGVPTTDGHGRTRRAIRRWSVFVGVIPWSLFAARSAPDVQFSAVTSTLGIAFAHKNSATSNKYLVETMGGGVALLDYDNDGRLDLFFTNGARVDDPMAQGALADKS